MDLEALLLVALQSDPVGTVAGDIVALSADDVVAFGQRSAGHC